MKKFALIAVAALALTGLASCDQFTMPDPPAQSNEPENAFAASDLTVVDKLNGTLDLAVAKEAGVNPVLLSYTVVNVPADRHVKFVMEMSTNAEFTKVAQVATHDNEDNTVSASVYDLQTAYSTTFSREPSAVTLYVRYLAYISNAAGTENIRVGGPDAYYCSASVNFTPVLLGHTVENSYYLVGSFNNFQAASAVPLVKSDEGNPYDYPDFYLAFQVSAEQAFNGFSWAIIPGSAYTAGNLDGAFVGSPSNVSDPLKGALVQTIDPATTAVAVPEPGSYMIKVNMYDLTYSIALAYETLYLNASGYYSQYDKMLRLFTNDYVNYGGVLRCSKNFRIACQPSATGLFYGLAADSETVTEGTVTKGQLQSYSELGGTAAIVVPVNGFYYCRVNLKNLTWELDQIENISVVGAFNGWNQADATTTMTPDKNMVTYTYRGLTLEAGQEFKFNCNKDWALSFGGAYDNIVENGGNLVAPEAGTFDVTLNFTTIPYSVTLVKTN